MGPATLAAIPLSESCSLPRGPSSSPLDALPSPARNVDFPPQSLSTPSNLDDDPTSPLWTPRPLLMPDSTSITHVQLKAIANDPASVPNPPVPVHLPVTDMNLIVGGALAPVPEPAPLLSKTSTSSLPSCSALRSKPGPGLQLPSFKSLGIAAPHHAPCLRDPMLNVVLPDDSLVGSTKALSISDSASGDERELLTGFAPRESRDGNRRDSGNECGGRAVKASVQSYVTTLTPPAEQDSRQWTPLAAVTNATLDSPDTDPDVLMNTAPETNPNMETETPVQPESLLGEGEESYVDQEGGGAPESPFWYDGAIRSVLENLQTSSIPDNPLRILSHALPCPSSAGHIYPNIISSLHEMTPSSPTVWINVFHAIPGRFNLADLPTSPPATPGPAVGGDDYFTQKVFDSAVPISDYQSDLSSLPRSPRPVVPPSSINVSVVERYIPPTSVHEFTDMFNMNGPSILVDRLVELSPHNGSLVFIYPTRTGAQTFMKEYLGPLLDPIIRSMVVVNGLSSDLGRNLASKASVDRLPEHDDMHRQMVLLCEALSQRSTATNNGTMTNSTTMQHPHFHTGRRGQLELTYVAKREVMLPRDVWARDWWSKQEKPRVKDVVTQVALEAQRKMSNLDHTERSTAPAELIQQLLDSVCRRAYQAGKEPERGIEVSVFVIKRTGGIS